jgi:hypothetical protein
MMIKVNCVTETYLTQSLGIAAHTIHSFTQSLRGHSRLILHNQLQQLAEMSAGLAFQHFSQTFTVVGFIVSF